MNSNLIIIIFSLLLLISITFTLILFIRRGTIINDRFKDFSIEPIKDDELSLFDIIRDSYLKIRKRTSNYLNKIKIFDEYSKKYQKYVNRAVKEDAMDYMADKTLMGVLFIVIIIIFDVLRGKGFTILQLLTAFLLGFFVLDFYLNLKGRIRKKKIEKDMLKAIIIMNNAFKSNLSIMQAIYTVYHELDGYISEEFRKMYIDLTFGLTTDIAFERFNERVDNDEARYITTSLNVLNKTGGNIVQVFSSVEKNAFTRKKLNDELRSLSSSARAIFKILVSIPIILFLLIISMNPSYFNPLFNDPIGWLVLLVCILLYSSYIFIIRRVMKAGIR